MEVANQLQVYAAPVATLPNDNRSVTVSSENPKYKNELQKDCVELSDDEYAEYEEVFDEEQAKKDLDTKLDEIKKHQQDLHETADKLEEIDNKYAKGAGKLLRYGAAAVGIAGTFLASKYSSKLLIETLKSAAKSPTLSKIPEMASSLKTPIENVAKGAKGFVENALKDPAVKSKVDKVLDSSIVKSAKAVMENKTVSRLVEPIKNTLLSVKDIKINGKSIQSLVENTMATTTTGCVIIDDLTGRNNNKSAVDLAVGS